MVVLRSSLENGHLKRCFLFLIIPSSHFHLSRSIIHYSDLQSNVMADLVAEEHPCINHSDSFGGSESRGGRFRRYAISCHSGHSISTSLLAAWSTVLAPSRTRIRHRVCARSSDSPRSLRVRSL